MNAIAFLLVYIGISYVIGNDRYDSLATQYSYVNDKVLLSFEHLYDEVDQLTSNIIFNEYVQKALRAEGIDQREASILKTILSYQMPEYLDAYFIFDNKGNLYSSQAVELEAKQLKKSMIYQSLKKNDRGTKLVWARDIFTGSYDMSLFAVKRMKAFDPKIESGVLILKFNQEIFRGMDAVINDPELGCLIINEEGGVCFERTPAKVLVDTKRKKEIIQFSQDAKGEAEFKSYKNGIVIGASHQETGFKVILYAPYEVTEKTIRSVMNIMLVLFFIVYLISCFSLIWYTKRLTTPIALLSDTMTKFDDTRLERTVEFHTNTEIDTIGESYNEMLTKVKSLMEDIKDKEAQLRESELNILLYQIRPHFLYNTLDNIYMLARLHKDETIMKMIQALSKLLRINLSNGNAEIGVKEELECVCAYLEIQKIRNVDLFCYQVHCSEEASQYQVVKMLLQPIVENCIKYGFSEIYEGGKIELYVEVVNHELVFRIENNGSLIEDKKLLELNRLETMPIKQMDEMIRHREGGFGTINVVKRLRLRYGNRVGFHYVSNEATTVCTIKIDTAMLN